MADKKIDSKYILNHKNFINKSYAVEPATLLQTPDQVKSLYDETLDNLYDGVKYTIGYMGSGVNFKNGKDIALGANYFLKANNKCDSEESQPKCQGKPKYIYVRNVPTGTIPPLNLSFYNATGCNLTGITEGRGLVPALFEDIYDINPIEVTKGMLNYGNLGSDVCKEMTLPVGKNIYDQSKENKTWNYETKCTSSHHTMTESTNKELNQKIREKNPLIVNARLPGPHQLRENFINANSKTTSQIILCAILVGICITITNS